MSDLRAEISRGEDWWGRVRWEVHLFDSETREPDTRLSWRGVGVKWERFATYAEAARWADSQVRPLRTWQHKSRGIIRGRLLATDGEWVIVKLRGDHPGIRVFEEDVFPNEDGAEVALLASNMMEVQIVPARAAS